MARKIIGRRTLFAGAALCLLAIPAMIAAALSQEKPSVQKMILNRYGVTKALIVNADDFGMSDEINSGIVKGFHDGIITSTSLMVPSKSFEGAIKAIEADKSLDVGVHLILAQDDPEDPGPVTPVDKVKSLVGKDGHFPTNILGVGKADKNEILTELTAQLDTALARGVDVTHFDCHKGFYHTYDARMLKLTINLAKKYRLPIRWQGKSSDPILTSNGIVVPDYLTALDIKGPLSPKKAKLLDIIRNMPDGITELLIHPSDGDPKTSDRATHLALALDPDIKLALKNKGIKLIGYKDLRNAMRAFDGK